MYRTLFEVLQKTATGDNQLNKLVFLDSQYTTEKELTYDLLYKKVIAFANELYLNNIKKGHKILLNVMDPYQYIISFWGAVMGGVIPIVLPYDKNISGMGQFEELVEGIQKSFGKLPVIVDESGNTNDLYDQVINFDNFDQRLYDNCHCNKLDINENDIAVIYYSSGSSGTPKGIPLTHKQMICQISAINKRLNITSSDEVLNWLPLTHIFGFTHFHMSAVFSGANQTQMSTQTFLTSPHKYLEYIGIHKTTLTGGMNISTRMLTDILTGESSYDLAWLKHYILCGEPTNVNYLNEFLDAAHNHNMNSSAIKTAYAMTETGCVISIEDEFLLQEETESGGKIVSQGKPYDCIKVIIMDESGNILRDKTPGEVCVKGDVVFNGYCNDNLNSHCFINGFFKTGDIGYFSDGRLFISGRKKDIIIVYGLNYFPIDIENAIYTKLNIRTIAMQLMCKDGDSKELLFFETDHVNDANTVKNIISLIKDYSMLEFDEFIPVEDIYVTQRGKTDRKRMESEYKKGIFKESIEPESLNKYDACKKELSDKDSFLWIKEELRNIWEEILKVKPKDEDDFYLLGGSSIKFIVLKEKIASTFHVDISMKSLRNADTFNECCKVIAYNQLENDEVEILVNPDTERQYEPFPLTEIQLSYLLGRDEVYEGGGISTQIYFEYETSLDIHRLEDAINKVIGLQPCLRTIIYEDGTQKVLENVPEYKIDIIDLSSMSVVDRTLQIETTRNRVAKEVFPLEHWPLFSFKALKTSINEYRLMLVIDLIILDAFNVLEFKNLIMKFYNNPELGVEPLKFTFRDFVVGLGKIKQTKKYEEDKAYWMSKLDTFPLAPQLKYAIQPASMGIPDFRRKSFVLEEEGYKKLKGLSKKYKVSVPTIISTIYAAVLSNFSNQEKCSLNFTVFNRYKFHKDIERLMGDFTSTLLVPFDFQACDKNIFDIIAQVQEDIMDGLEHRYFGGVSFGRELKLAKSLGNSAIMPYVFTSTVGIDDNLDRLDLGELVSGASQTAQVFIDCQVHLYKGKLMISWDYIRQLFDEDIIDEMFYIFENGISKLDDKISVNDMLYSETLSQSITSYNDTNKNIPSKTLHGMFQETVSKYPDKFAVKDEKGSYTYAQLNEMSSKVAALLQEKGVGHGDFVGVKANRRKETIANILGILKAGAAYVPIDPDNPESRQMEILKKSKCRLCVEHNFVEKEPVISYSKVECDTFDIAYVIYTSGSTGTPKGVVITHDAAANTIQDINSRFKVGAKDNIIGLSSICFDLSVYDIFGSLAAGATLVMLSDIYDIRRIIRIVEREGITIWNSVPAIMQMYIDELELVDDNNTLTWCEITQNTHIYDNMLRLVMLSGDWIPISLPERIFTQLPDAELVSLGGATEASIWSIYYPVTKINPYWKSVPYGMPLANQTFYVMGYNNMPCPRGASGELCIGGRGVALGYHNDEEKTNASYFVHPEYGRLYRTGDYGALTKEGYIEFLGRKDTQIKIRGHRIELGEIESAIRQQALVQDAVVIVRKGSNNELSICAYVVYEGVLDVLQMKIAIGKLVPQYMVPTYILQLEQIPLTSNGKVDRKHLPDVENSKSEGVLQPVTMTERALHKIWCQVLGSDEIGINVDFFDAGGDSLKLIRIASEIEKTFLVHASHSDLVNSATISLQAKLIEESMYDGIIEKSNIISVTPDIHNRYEPFELTPMQNAYYVGRDDIYDLGGISTHGYYEYKVEIDIERFEKALNKVISSQPMLRMVMTKDGKQKFLKDVYYKIDVIDLKDQTPKRQENVINSMRQEMSHAVMDVFSWPLYKLVFVRLNDSEGILIFSVDLLTMDAASVQMFKHLVMQAYENPEQILIEPDFSFRDFVHGLECVNRSKMYEIDASYWMEKAKNFPTAPQLPLLMPVEDVDKPVFKRIGLNLDKEQWTIIKNIIAKHGVSASTAICVIYTAVMSYYSNQSSCAMNMTTFNRFDFHEDVDKIIGDFTSTMLLGMDFNGHNDFWTFIKNVQNEVTANLEHRSFSGMEFIREVRKHKKIGKNAAVPIVFTSTLSSSNAVFDKDFGEMTYGVSQTSQVYIDCQVMEAKGELYITWDYVEQLFDKDIINQMFHMFESGLKKIADDTKIEDIFKLDQKLKKVVDNYNNTYQKIASKTLHGMFEESVARYPNKLAVKDNEGSLTYIQLDKMACKVAALLQKNGIGRGSFVGVQVHRQKETIANILGILKAGAAYVPIDPKHPEKRRNEILSNSKCSLCIQKEYGVEESLENYENSFSETSDIAYVIYTSGSTGKPKGVVITHDAAANTIQDINTRFNVRNDDSIIGLSSMCFDLSVYDIFGSLAEGATLVMVPDIHDVRNTIELVKREGITIWNSVPAVMQTYVDELDYIIHKNEYKDNSRVHLTDLYNTSLRLVMLSGDWIPLTLPEKIFRQMPDTEVVSLGGATEASIWSIYYPVKEVNSNWKSIPYGMPLANQTFYVFGYNNIPCPIGVPGELYIGGRGVALGYHNDQEKTNASYFIHPEYGWLYRTGDYGVLRKEGYIEFLGRKDTQIKIRGHRIELGEIESAIRQQPGVKDAAAIVKKSDNDTLSIYAFVVYDGCLDTQEIKNSVAELLPKYMMPSNIIQIDKIPLTSNAKVDRQALDSIHINEVSEKFLSPVTEIESTLVKVWCEVMGLERISTNADFYDIGGDSIKLFSIVARSEEIFGVNFPRESVFSIENIKDMAMLIERNY